MVIKIADLKIGIENKYNYIVKMSEDYIVEDTEPDFLVSVTDEEITAEDDVGGLHPGYLEYLAIYRKISEKILEYNGLLMHGVLLECDGKGVLFCAKSGVGKTTHTTLWKKLYGERCEIVNGDKPLIRIIDGKVYAYGTPWNGKEGIHKNKRCELSAICFIVRGEKNEITDVGADKVQRALTQTYMPKNDPIKMLKTLELVDEILSKVTCKKLFCNTDISAAEVAYKGLIG